MYDKRSAVGEQDLVKTFGQVGDFADIFTDGDAADAELLAIIWIDGQRSFQLSEVRASCRHHDLERVLAGSDVELIFVVERLLAKFFDFFLAIEIEHNVVAEARGDRTILLIGDSEYVHLRVLLAVLLVESKGSGRNFHGEVHARLVGRRVKERRGHGHSKAAGLRSVGPALQFLLHRLAGE